MSIAKSINAIGKYDFYSFDDEAFAKNIGNFFKVNLKIVFHYDYEDFDNQTPKETEFLDLGYEKTLHLDVRYFKLDEDLPSYNNVTNMYEIRIPVDLKYIDKLLIEFNDTGFFQVNFIPFNGAWILFIDDLLGINDDYHNSKKDLIVSILKVRKTYVKILQQINCSSVILTTDGAYRFEQEMFVNPNTKLKSLDDFIQFMKDEDGIKFYNFMDVLINRPSLDSKRNSYLDIALIDNFDDSFVFE
jgi:hypothetical protein